MDGISGNYNIYFNHNCSFKSNKPAFRAADSTLMSDPSITTPSEAKNPPKQPSFTDNVKERILSTFDDIQMYFQKDQISNPTVVQALKNVEEVKFATDDINHMRNMGINVIYKDGKEALRTLQERGCKIKFGRMDKAQAQYDNKNNTLIINKKYKDTKDPAVIMGIAEAIIHELGHARDRDGDSSRQEEKDCMALNTMAHRYNKKYHAQAFNSSNDKDNKNLIDVLNLYERLYFDPDPQKRNLERRLDRQYAELSAESRYHTTPFKNQQA